MRPQATLRRHDAERDLLLCSVLSRHAGQDLLQRWERVVEKPTKEKESPR